MFCAAELQWNMSWLPVIAFQKMLFLFTEDFPANINLFSSQLGALQGYLVSCSWYKYILNQQILKYSQSKLSTSAEAALHEMCVAVQFLRLLPGITLLCCTLTVLNHSGSGQFLGAAQWLLRICCCVLLVFGTCHARSSKVFNNVRRLFWGSGDGAVLQASY